MERLCFVSPDLEHATKVVRHLKEDGFGEENIYAIGRSDLPMEELPDPGVEESDLMPAVKRGVTVGGVAGVFAGLVAVAFPPAGIVVGGGGVLLLGVLGAGIGGLGTAITGAAVPNTRLKEFEDDIKAGRILIMVDVPEDRVEHVNELVGKLDPEVEPEGPEPPAPFIPR